MVKRALIWYFTSLLTDYKWYRRRQGGVWFLIEDPDGSGGFASPVRYWTRDSMGFRIVKTEQY